MTVLSPNTTTHPRAATTPRADKSTPQTGLAIPPVIYVKDLSGTCAKRAATTAARVPAVSGEYHVGTRLHRPGLRVHAGTAYVSGTPERPDHRSARAQDIVAVGDIKYADKADDSDDILGLIPTHFVWVYHPIKKCSRRSYANMLSTPVTEIDAAILAMRTASSCRPTTRAPASPAVGRTS